MVNGLRARLRAEFASRTAYRLLLRRSIDSGALREWRRRLAEDPECLVPLVNALVTSQEYRNLVADQWADAVVLNYLHHERCRLVRNLPPAEVIVDLGGAEPNDPRGCLQVMGYRHPYRQLTIVDVPPQQSVEQQRARVRYGTVDTPLGPVRYVYGPMQDLARAQLIDGSVDLFWMGQSIEHIAESDLDELLPAIWRALRPGGRFCFDTPNRRVTRLHVPDTYIHPDHKIEYEVGPLRAKVERAGFEVLRIAGIGLAREACAGRPFSTTELIDNMPVNGEPEQSYVMYFDLRRPLA